ncbi:MAG TPA: hypothetical protein ENF81_00135 [Thermotogaceae bacterium]|nr:hypothetical protein [Thermotogaceae bacterium]
MFYKIASEWLNKKSVPIMGRAIFSLPDGKEKQMGFRGSISFLESQPIISFEVQDNIIKRYPVALWGLNEDESIRCLYFDPADPSKYAVFVIKEEI